MEEKFQTIASFLAILAIAGFIGTRSLPRFPQPAAAAAGKPIEVRWLLAHQPTELFSKAAAVFADDLAKDSGGTMELSVILPKDLGYTGDIPTADVMQILQNGKAELGTTYVVGIAGEDPELNVLNLPYLFTDYASATKVLDGDAGKELLATIGENTPARGLAFTYSGGFRIIVSNTPIRTAADFKGLHIATAGGPVAEEALKALGATPIPVTIGASGAPEPVASADAVETTYTRLSGALGEPPFRFKYISDTYHSLFLTAILASKSFYDTLTPAQQDALMRAAQDAAAVERQDSIALGAQTRTDIQKEGVTVIVPSQDALAALKQKLQPVYGTFAPQFGQNTIDAIVGAQQ